MHHKTVRNLVTSGKIKAVKGGKAWLIHPDAIAEWMKAGTSDPSAEDDE
jgi:excisionase family DNA binding protein